MMNQEMRSLTAQFDPAAVVMPERITADPMLDQLEREMFGLGDGLGHLFEPDFVPGAAPVPIAEPFYEGVPAMMPEMAFGEPGMPAYYGEMVPPEISNYHGYIGRLDAKATAFNNMAQDHRFAMEVYGLPQPPAVDEVLGGGWNMMSLLDERDLSDLALIHREGYVAQQKAIEHAIRDGKIQAEKLEPFRKPIDTGDADAEGAEDGDAPFPIPDHHWKDREHFYDDPADSGEPEQKDEEKPAEGEHTEEHEEKPATKEEHHDEAEPKEENGDAEESEEYSDYDDEDSEDDAVDAANGEREDLLLEREVEAMMGEMTAQNMIHRKPHSGVNVGELDNLDAWLQNMQNDLNMNIY